MKIKYNKQSGQVTIKLDTLEVRQFLWSSAAVDMVRQSINHTLLLVDGKKELKPLDKQSKIQ